MAPTVESACRRSTVSPHRRRRLSHQRRPGKRFQQPQAERADPGSHAAAIQRQTDRSVEWPAVGGDLGRYLALRAHGQRREADRSQQHDFMAAGAESGRRIPARCPPGHTAGAGARRAAQPCRDSERADATTAGRPRLVPAAAVFEPASAESFGCHRRRRHAAAGSGSKTQCSRDTGQGSLPALLRAMPRRAGPVHAHPDAAAHRPLSRHRVGLSAAGRFHDSGALTPSRPARSVCSETRARTRSRWRTVP